MEISRTRTILAVDDSRTNLNVLGARLGRLGYLMMLSGSGREALDLIAARGIDLVLLDMVMPDVSGLDVLTDVRATPETAELPIIMVTSRSEPQAAVEALAAGADDWIAKPFAFEVLAARIERTLERSRRLGELKRANAALDARIAARAIELGEMRAELASSQADRSRLIASIHALHGEIDRLSPGSIRRG
ncbi:response regulator [Sphingomonas sp.]|uniref:response regulator n=1 Tax=Sphingomonas sp. TaxID=28214 RepID=UPI002CB3DE12|nr:response regulator [Sphingomonas sp.]HWK36624.1 response regulator [Sphingomonas sp.]